MAFLSSLPVSAHGVVSGRRLICTGKRVAVRSHSSCATRVQRSNRALSTVSMRDDTQDFGTDVTENADVDVGGAGVGGLFDVDGWNVILCGLMTGLIVAGSDVAPAYAVIPEVVKSTFKTKPLSLAHPVVMWAIFASVLYTGWLGWQSRSIRSEGISKEKKKELVSSKVSKRHFVLSASIMATMTLFTFEGMANTYTRTGKLFPGPHLYAGLGLVALMSGMSAFVPQMQSGKMWARNAHFALALPTVALFAWQANTGMVIVGKLLGWK